MNERIIELANKANAQVGYTFKLEDANQIHELMEKFAELIIKETLEVARAGIEYGDGMEDAVYKYFGVEE